jgi:nitrate/nitrite transporter NarK
MTAVLTAGVIGSPISGALLSLHGLGLAGWQWLFLLEGLPSVVLGFVVLRVLPERPADARWLSAAERAALAAALDQEMHAASRAVATTGQALTNGRVWLLSLMHFMTIPIALYGIGFWLPQMIKTASRGSDLTVGALTAIPYAAGAIAMVMAGRHSDRTGERRWHIATAASIVAIGLMLATQATAAVSSVAAFSIAMAGVASMMGPFWALASSRVSGVGAAASIALINSVGNTGGFVGPYLLGAINDATHSFTIGLLAIAAILMAGGALALILGEQDPIRQLPNAVRREKGAVRR